jgi:hypothetical protein
VPRFLSVQIFPIREQVKQELHEKPDILQLAFASPSASGGSEDTEVFQDKSNAKWPMNEYFYTCLHLPGSNISFRSLHSYLKFPHPSCI